MFHIILFLLSFGIIISLSFFLIRLFLYRTALIYVVKKWIHCIEDFIHVHQTFRVPEFNEGLQENQFYLKVYTYLNSLSSIEDSDFTNLFSGEKPNDIILSLDDNQVVEDNFLGARVSWKNEVEKEEQDENDERCCEGTKKRGRGRGRRSLLLKMKKKDKRRILRPYLQHILNSVSDETESKKREVKLFMNFSLDHRKEQRWSSVRFTHPSTFETIAMDSDLKNRIKSDLESFHKSKQYYHRLGRVWKRSYLLYGPSGTGKSSFVAAIAKFLSYDIYDIDLSRISDDSDLKMLLLQTSTKSVILIEDLDLFMNQKSNKCLSLSGILNFMDGIVSSCCGDEKIMIFTMNTKQNIDESLLRPGRIDVHIYFPLCNFNCFKILANSYLGIKDHKLFPQVEEIFQTGVKISPAEISEIMIMNRSSPSRALKSVITALQTNGGDLRGKIEPSSSVEEKDTVAVGKEVRKLYGLLRLKSCIKSGPSDRYSDLIER